MWAYVFRPRSDPHDHPHLQRRWHPLGVEEVAPRQFAVDGTPTDCVNLAVCGILPGRPGLVISGINKGANMGDDITYSGTVSAAMEGTLLGIPSVAVSLVARDHFEFAA